MMPLRFLVFQSRLQQSNRVWFRTIRPRRTPRRLPRHHQSVGRQQHISTPRRQYRMSRIGQARPPVRVDLVRRQTQTYLKGCREALKGSHNVQDPGFFIELQGGPHPVLGRVPHGEAAPGVRHQVPRVPVVNRQAGRDVPAVDGVEFSRDVELVPFGIPCQREDRDGAPGTGDLADVER